ncbi:hypothetical protein A0H81_08302 [Grifola frondosa]|uniref:Uncharacterized protein n=1 Tax=Grifola frondosa TaxID=5627 RepID=A0A1C7M623_GRIFR|nr:hypothetical protein A0H81_08302 [Grifola frondosa]
MFIQLSRAAQRPPPQRLPPVPRPLPPAPPRPGYRPPAQRPRPLPVNARRLVHVLGIARRLLLVLVLSRRLLVVLGIARRRLLLLVNARRLNALLLILSWVSPGSSSSWVSPAGITLAAFSSSTPAAPACPLPPPLRELPAICWSSQHPPPTTLRLPTARCSRGSGTRTSSPPPTAPSSRRLKSSAMIWSWTAHTDKMTRSSSSHPTLT